MNSKQLKLCVIDDVKKVVDAISKQIAWHEYGIQVVGTALNGEQGLKMAREMKPDIILTDIRMPRLDGLEMTEQLLKESPLSKVILMSGFTDFAYAQKAIRIGAFDFVTKPFSLEEIIRVTLKAKEMIEIERENMLNTEAMKKRLAESMPILRQEYLNLLLHHRMDEDSIKQRWDFLDIDMNVTLLAVMVIEIDHFNETISHLPIQEVELMRFTLQNVLEETLSPMTKGIVFRETVSRFVCIYNPIEALKIEQLAEMCRANVEKYTRFTISIGQGSSVSLNELPLSYRQAIQAISYHFYVGGNAAFSYESSQKFDDRVSPFLIDRDHELFYAFRAGNLERTNMILNQLIEKVSTGDKLPQPEMLTSAFLELLYMLLRVLLERMPYAVIEPIEREIYAIQIGNPASLQELQQLLMKVCEEGCQLIEQHRVSESSQIVNDTLQYVKQNLNKDITMQSCAKMAHLSPSYFSNLFKKVTGKTFSQFILNEKIERAKSMLLDDVQVQTIANELGYEERRYFSDIFKKYTGMTPTEFKLSYLVDGKKTMSMQLAEQDD